MNIKYILFVGILTLISFAQVRAESVIQLDLFYDRGSEALRLDRESTDPVTIREGVIEGYEVYLSQDSMNIIGISPAESQYTLQYQGFQTGYTWDNYLLGPMQDGAFKLTIPYYTHAKTVTIRDARGASLELALEPYSSCNQNYICEYESRETINSCPTDCTGSQITFSEQTLAQLQAENGVLRDQQGTVLLEIPATTSSTEEPTSQEGSWITRDTLMLGLGILLVIGALGLFGYRWWKGRQ